MQALEVGGQGRYRVQRPLLIALPVLCSLSPCSLLPFPLLPAPCFLSLALKQHLCCLGSPARHPCWPLRLLS